MGLTFGLTFVREIFDKLLRDASLLDEEVTNDRLFNFVVTGRFGTRMSRGRLRPARDPRIRPAAVDCA